MSPSAAPTVKAVILIAGPQKGTRFRPLSLDVPKPLFPVAGLPMIQHHIEALSRVDQLKEILILGVYTNAEMAEFVREMTLEYDIPIRYLQEYTALGTAGGIYHFRDRILGSGRSADAFFVLNGDVCADFPLQDMLAFHRDNDAQNGVDSNTLVTMMATEATRAQSLNYGCVVEDRESHKILHYVEKPTSYVSSLINCGVYIFSAGIFQVLADRYRERQAEAYGQNEDAECMWIEKDILAHVSGTGRGQVFQTSNWWSQIKTAGSAIYANRHYLNLYENSKPERLTKSLDGCGPKILGNVFIDPSAKVHATAVLGPNVSIGKNVTIGAGTRVADSIILAQSVIGEHTLLKHTVIGMNTRIGNWTRVEGTPNDPNPNKPFAKMENLPLFNVEGKLNPSITIIGCHVIVPSEIIVLNAIVLPHKQISHSFKNEIIL